MAALGSAVLYPPSLPMDVERLRCWFLHRHEREVLIPGILPWGLDAVVFCWRCDRFRGRPESTRPIVAHPFAAGA